MTIGDGHWAGRVDGADWAQVAADLDQRGWAALPRLLSDAEARELRTLYADEGAAFRATVDMARHRFGRGEYRYLNTPYPRPVERLKQSLYPRLLPIARDWWCRLGREAPWPDSLDEWLALCHAAGQRRSTALLLRYQAGDWNALHRDLYGDLAFPLQVVIGLTEPSVDHTGGEFLLVEQRPRAQSRGASIAVPLGRGVVFTTADRPIASARGWTAAPIRHGVSEVRAGERMTLGLVFHDAT